MIYRLKNSDFKPFFGIFDEKVSDLWVYVREGIGVYFGIFLSGKVCPGVGELVGWKGVKKLFIDKLGRIKNSNVGCQ